MQAFRGVELACWFTAGCRKSRDCWGGLPSWFSASWHVKTLFFRHRTCNEFKGHAGKRQGCLALFDKAETGKGESFAC